MKTIIYWSFFLVLGASTLRAQELTGRVLDERGEPIFGAYLYCLQDAQRGTHSDLDGTFLLATCPSDSLRCSFLGYQAQTFGPEIWDQQSVDIILQETALSIALVEVMGQNPVLEDFAAQRLERLEVYQNPLAAGDVLKALNSLPASTTLDETANPSLRGSDPDRSRVVLNGVPIYQPVRNSQINGLGNFSLFNTAIMEREYVFASNPPLSYGNTSAGLVELETVQEIREKQLEIGLSLASVGFLYGQQLPKGGLIQVYGNHQFSEPFLWTNPGLEDLRSFGNLDMGMHWRQSIGAHWSTSLFVYGIQEDYAVDISVFGYRGASTANSKRLFAVHNWEWQKERHQFAVRLGFDRQKGDYELGNLRASGLDQRQYYALQYRWWPADGWNLQAGVQVEQFMARSQDTFPAFFFAYQPEAPILTQNRNEQFGFGESYLVVKRNWGDRWSVGAGVRANLFASEVPWYFSAQLSVRYQPKAGQRLLLSGGQYHSLATSNAFRLGGELLRSQQIALDYRIERANWTLEAAIYYKNDEGANPQEFADAQVLGTQTLGLEIGGEKTLGRYWQLQGSYTYLHQDQELLEKSTIPGTRDLDYFVRGAIAFNRPDWFSASLFVIGRQGNPYTPVIGGVFEPMADAYEPIYANVRNQERYEDYWSVGASINKMWMARQFRVITFLNLSNALNRQNQRGWFLEGDYTVQQASFFQPRTIYFGSVWSLR
ncbi:MAG: carboxypeptidase-like regulatory domain-containing protein [Bacteroidota bacterium]